jgi:hypothetical protein
MLIFPTTGVIAYTMCLHFNIIWIMFTLIIGW